MLYDRMGNKAGPGASFEWATETIFAYDLLDQTDKAFVRREGENIYITLPIGFALYHITEDAPLLRRCKAILVTGGMGKPSPLGAIDGQERIA